MTIVPMIGSFTSRKTASSYLVIQIYKRLYLTVGQYTVHQRHQVNWYPTFKAHLREVYTIHIVFLVEVGFRPSPTGEEKPTKNFYASKRGGIFYNVVHELTAKWIYFIIQFFYRKSNCRFMVTHYVK